MIRNDDHQADAQMLTFESNRSTLFGLAYRMLGTVADAEDVVQEAWIRWQRTDPGTVKNPDAFLTTIVTRLAVDRLRRIRARREEYPGSWLPEPVLTDPDPQDARDIADSVSMALLVVLETLSPLERASFVLHEVFQRPYHEVAAILGRSESAVRQLVHRAREHVDEGHARYQADHQTHAEVVNRFLQACVDADTEALVQLLAPDVVIISDGGGAVRAPRRPVNGRDDVVRLLMGFRRNAPADVRWELTVFNSRLGIIGRQGSVAFAAMAVSVRDGSVQSLHLIANPEKLAQFQQSAPRPDRPR